MSLRISALSFNDRNQECAVTVKVKVELSVLQHHTMKTCCGVEVKLHTLQTSQLAQGKLRTLATLRVRKEPLEIQVYRQLSTVNS